MNYKKLKRVFALGMAVLISVSTSVYGGTIEVHAAEVISDNLLENEVIDNSSLEGNTEKKGDVQGDTQGAGQDDGQDNAQNAGQGDSNDNVQNAEQGDVQGDTLNAEQANTQSTEQEKIQVNIQGDAQDAGQDATVLTEQDEEPAALAATMAAPTKVDEVAEGSYSLDLVFEDSVWLQKIKGLKVNDITFDKGSSVFDFGNKYFVGSYNGGLALRIIRENISYPATMMISADGYEDLKLNIKKRRKILCLYLYRRSNL